MPDPNLPENSDYTDGGTNGGTNGSAGSHATATCGSNGTSGAASVSACACCQALDLIRTRQVLGHIPQPQTLYQFAPPQQPAEEQVSPTALPAAARVEKRNNILNVFESVLKKSDKHGAAGSTRQKQAAARQKAKATGPDETSDEDWLNQAESESKGEEKLDQKPPKPLVPRAWHGVDGLAVTILGVILPTIVALGACYSMPKRLTLVSLNHPLETLAEALLVLNIPIANYFIWTSFKKTNHQFGLKRGTAIGAALATSLALSAISVAGLFFGDRALEYDLGTNFADGFAWMSIIYILASLASVYIIAKFRQTRDFAKSRALVISYTAVGALLALFTLFGAEQRPWCIRLAEKMSMSNDMGESKQGLDWLRGLQAEKELRMECSDNRAAGLAGLFIPLKSTAQERLYFTLTGQPYSYRNEKNSDFSQMSDEYVNQHVVGEKVDGLSLTRSSLSGVLHPRTLTSTINWTFVFKNDSTQEQETRAEIGLPVGAVVTDVSVWHDGIKADSLVAATDKAEGVTNWVSGSGGGAMLTNLGRGRVLMHCDSVPADKEVEVQVSMAVPLKADGPDRCTLVPPKFIATNFDIRGDHQLKLRSPLTMASSSSDLKEEKTAANDHLLSGSMTARQLENTEFEISTLRPALSQPLYTKDKIATLIKQQIEKQKELDRIRNLENSDELKEVVVMIDGSKGIQNQLQGLRNALSQGKSRHTRPLPRIKVVKPVYVVQTVKQMAARAPKRLLVVVDGSATTEKYKNDLVEALKSIPAEVPTQIILAARNASDRVPVLDLKEGIKQLRADHFVGGQDNLRAVVKAAELAGDIAGGAVLWIHGPQPILNNEIYIVSNYVAHPRFFEMPLDSGDMDVYAYFKNHAEIGPFSQVPRNGKVKQDLKQFLSKWQGGIKDYEVVSDQTESLPKLALEMSPEESREVIALNANQRCADLISTRHKQRATRLAIDYHIVTPVTAALVKQEQQDANDSGVSLQSASNGTIGEQGADATYVTGVNTAGTVRVNNLANLEALLNIIANLGEIGALLTGAVIVAHALCLREPITELFGRPVEISPIVRIAFGIALVLIGLAVPGTINWFVASARDANLFS